VHLLEWLVLAGGVLFMVLAFMPARPGVSRYQSRLGTAAGLGLGTWLILGILARSLKPGLDYAFYAYVVLILLLMAWGRIRARAV
jgi:hypothetical protein